MLRDLPSWLPITATISPQAPTTIWFTGTPQSRATATTTN
jgi:hypothetical protein